MGSRTQGELGGRTLPAQVWREWGLMEVGLLVEFLWEGLFFLCKREGEERGVKHLRGLRRLGKV